MRSSHYATPPSHAPRNSRVRHAVALALAGSVVGWASMALAGPEDGQVVSGSANISTPGAGMTLIEQSTHRAVIDWRTFSVGAGETVQFLQPSTSSATLNRVLGGQQSVIDGALRANGNIFLLNSSGILFGRNATVDVGGLVASTGRMANDDFLAGRYQLRPGAEAGAAVVNEGHLRIRDGGMAALVAPHVRNSGIIVARLGRVALLGSEAVTVDLYGDQLLTFALPGSADGSLAGSNVAVTPEAAAAVLDSVVNRTGQESASHAARIGNTVVLSAGGGVEHDGTIDVSGTGGGGRVDLLASDISIGSHALIAADALDQGDGGRVIVWSSGSTEFEGRITARGGSNQGDGGFVEVSGAQRLRFFGDVVATAENGAAGTVLLDPRTITITADGTNTATDNVTDSVIDGDALTALLRSSQNVVLTADDSITVNYLIDGRPVTGNAASGSLAMTAGAIVINAPVITNNASINLTSTTGDVTIQGDGFLYVANGVGQSGNAGINIDAAGNIVTNASGSGAGQLISLGTIALRAGGSINLGGELAGLRLNNAPDRIGALVVTAVAGGIQLSGVDSRDVVTLAAANGITVGGKGISASGTVTLDGGSGTVAINAPPDDDAAAIEVRDAGSIDIETTGAVTIGGSLRTSNGAIEIGSTAERVASVATAGDAAIQARGTAGNVAIWSSGAVETHGIAAEGGISLTGTTLTNTDAALLATGGNISLTANRTGAAAIVLGAPSQGGAAVEARSPGANVTLSAAGGGVELGAGIRTSGGAITIGSSTAPIQSLATAAGSALDTGGSAGAVSVDATGSVALRGVRAGGNVTISGASVGNQGASIASAGDVSLNAVNGDITLSCIETNSACDAGTPNIDSTATVTLDAGGAVVLNGGVKATGSVDIGTANDRVASVTMASGTAIQAGAGATATSGISIFSEGDVAAQRLIVGSGGRISIDATAPGAAGANVRLNQGLGGFANSSGIGALRVAADGVVELNGVNAAGIAGSRAIDIFGSSIETTASAAGSLIAAGSGDADGNAIVLEAVDNGTILLRQVSPGAPAIDAAGSGSVALRTGGSVTLESGIRTAGGDISIGTDDRLTASVTTTPGALLITGAGGDIRISSSGTVDLHGVTSGGGAIVEGLEVINSTATLQAAQDFTITSGADGIQLNCIGTATECDGVQDDPDDKPFVAINAGGTTTLATTGDVNLQSGIRSGGDILIDSTKSVSMDALTVLQSGASIEIDADGDVDVRRLMAGTGSGQGVTVQSRGSVSIAEPVSGPLVGGTLQATGFLDVSGSSISTNGALVSGEIPDTDYGIRLIVGPGGHIDILGALTSRDGEMLIGLESAQLGAGNAQVNLSNNLLTENRAITINGDVTLFERIGRWDIDPLSDTDNFFPLVGDLDASAGGPSGPETLRHDPRDFNFCTAVDCGSINVQVGSNPDEFLVTGLDASNAVATYFVGPGNWVATGRGSDELNDQNGFNCAGVWICGYHYEDNFEVASANAYARDQRIREYLGQLVATIDTTGSQDVGANVVINGDVRRHVPVTLTGTPSTTALYVYDTHLNHTLSVDLGQIGVLTVGGSLGDTYENSRETGWYLSRGLAELNLEDIDLGSNGAPRLGLFRLILEGERTSNDLPLSIGGDAFVNSFTFNGDDLGSNDVAEWGTTSDPTPPPEQDMAGLSYWQSSDGAGGVGGRLTLVPRTYLLGVRWTARSRGTLDDSGLRNAGGYAAPGTFGQLPGDLSASVNVPGSTVSNSSPGSVTGATGVSAGAGSGGIGFSFSTPPDTGTISEPRPEPSDVPSVAEDQSRRDNREETGDGSDSSDEDLDCPRGASRSADVGNMPGVQGSAPAVFKQCAQDFT